MPLKVKNNRRRKLRLESEYPGSVRAGVCFGMQIFSKVRFSVGKFNIFLRGGAEEQYYRRAGD